MLSSLTFFLFPWSCLCLFSFFGPGASGESDLEIKANSFPLTLCQWSNPSKPSRLSKGTQKKNPTSILLGGFLVSPDWCLHAHAYTLAHAHICTCACTHTALYQQGSQGPHPHVSPASRHLCSLVMSPVYAVVLSPGAAWWKPPFSKSPKAKGGKKTNKLLLSGSIGWLCGKKTKMYRSW